jgi:hypothetical protein
MPTCARATPTRRDCLSRSGSSCGARWPTTVTDLETSWHLGPALYRMFLAQRRAAAQVAVAVRRGAGEPGARWQHREPGAR